MMGFITCLNDILIPHLKAIFDLSYVQAMLVQFCFFTAYAVMSIPMGKLVGKIGYKGGVIGGFLLTAVGCLLFYPAADSASYPTFLAALFILASSVTLLQVAGYPVVQAGQGIFHADAGTGVQFAGYDGCAVVRFDADSGRCRTNRQQGRTDFFGTDTLFGLGRRFDIAGRIRENDQIARRA